jgi:hypothetical protein
VSGVARHCRSGHEWEPSESVKRCPTCRATRKIDPKSKERTRRWVSENRERHNATMRRYRARRYAEDGEWRDSGPKAKDQKEWMMQLKSSPCLDCGGSFPACCMDFDHVRGGKKKHCIGTMFAHHYSRELILLELEKCDLVCSNCHRIRTRDRKKGSGASGRFRDVPEDSKAV